MSSQFFKNIVIDNGGAPAPAGDSKLAPELYCANCHGDVTLDDISVSLFGEQGLPTCRHCSATLLPMFPNQCLICRSQLKRPHALIALDGKPACATCKHPVILRNVPQGFAMPEEPQPEPVVEPEVVTLATEPSKKSGGQNLVPWLAAGILGVIIAIGFMLGNILNPRGSAPQQTVSSNWVGGVETPSRPPQTAQPINITTQIQIPPQTETQDTKPAAAAQEEMQTPAAPSQPTSQATGSESDAAESNSSPEVVSNTEPISVTDGKSPSETYLEKGVPIK